MHVATTLDETNQAQNVAIFCLYMYISYVHCIHNVHYIRWMYSLHFSIVD